jgi:hypothetical protein
MPCQEIKIIDKRSRIMLEESKYGLGGSIVDMIKTRVKDNKDGKTIKEVKPRLIQLLNDIGYYDNAPFIRVSSVFIYGIENLRVELKRISKKDKDIGVNIEIRYDWVEYFSWNDEEGLKQLFEASYLHTLIRLGKKYALPVEELEKRMEEIGGFPSVPDDYWDKLPRSPWRPSQQKIDEILEERRKSKVRLL